MKSPKETQHIPTAWVAKLRVKLWEVCLEQRSFENKNKSRQCTLTNTSSACCHLHFSNTHGVLSRTLATFGCHRSKPIYAFFKTSPCCHSGIFCCCLCLPFIFELFPVCKHLSGTRTEQNISGSLLKALKESLKLLPLWLLHSKPISFWFQTLF